APKQDEGELGNALRLHKRDDFKKFIERAEAAGHEDEAEAVLREADLAGEEIMKMQRQIGKTIAGLLMRQFDVEADGFAAALGRPLVRGFHDARAAAGDDGEIVLRQAFGNRRGGTVIFVVWACPRGTENGDRGANLRKRLEGIHKLGHDAENAPGILADEGSGFAHGCRIIKHREMKRPEKRQILRPVPRPRFLKSSRDFRRNSDTCNTRRCARPRDRSLDTSARPVGSARRNRLNFSRYARWARGGRSRCRSHCWFWLR